MHSVYCTVFPAPFFVYENQNNGFPASSHKLVSPGSGFLMAPTFLLLPLPDIWISDSISLGLYFSQVDNPVTAMKRGRQNYLNRGFVVHKVVHLL